MEACAYGAIGEEIGERRGTKIGAVEDKLAPLSTALCFWSCDVKKACFRATSGVIRSAGSHCNIFSIRSMNRAISSGLSSPGNNAVAFVVVFGVVVVVFLDEGDFG